MRSIGIAAFAVFLSSINTGLAQEDCVKCRQIYNYICLQNVDECVSACSGIGTSDKNSCQRRCSARDDGCNARATLKCGIYTPTRFSTPPPLRIQ